MKFTKTILASAVLLATSSFAIAATDTTEIEINVTKDAYVNLIGGLSGNTVVSLSEAQVNGAATILGDLGTESNTTGDCSLAVASDNDFELLHTTTATPTSLHSGAKYDIAYAGTTFQSGSANTVLLGGCNNLATDLVMNSPPITSAVVLAGTYSDTLTVTVTTQ